MKLHFMLHVARPACFVPTPAAMTRTRLPRICTADAFRYEIRRDPERNGPIVKAARIKVE